MQGASLVRDGLDSAVDRHARPDIPILFCRDGWGRDGVRRVNRRAIGPLGVCWIWRGIPATSSDEQHQGKEARKGSNRKTNHGDAKLETGKVLLGAGSPERGGVFDNSRARTAVHTLLRAPRFRRESLNRSPAMRYWDAGSSGPQTHYGLNGPVTRAYPYRALGATGQTEGESRGRPERARPPCSVLQ